MPSAHYRVYEDGLIEELISPSSLIWRTIPLVPVKENPVKKQVLAYTCDNCPAEGETENPKSWKKPLPYGWVDMNVVGNDGVLASKHLCPECWVSVLVALEERNDIFITQMPRPETENGE